MKNIFYKNNCKKAFTLAEVLITLAVIGVVAVLSIGIFMPKIQDKVLATQTKTAKIKFTKAMEQMALNNKIGPFYQDTEEFVSELQNYLKVARVCNNEHLSDCFGYDKITLANSREYSVSTLSEGDEFNLPKDSSNDFTGNTAGIVTIDGTPMILAWNKKCEILEPGVYQWGNNTNISTSCVAALMDVNGTKRPDKLGRDVILLNASAIGACIKFTVNGQTYTWGCPFEPKPLNRTECLKLLDEGKIQGCADENTEGGHEPGTGKKFWTDYDGDRWAGAVKTCGGTDKMPTPEDLAALATYLYDRESNPVGIAESLASGINLNAAKLASLNNDLYAQYTRRTPFTFSGGGSDINHSGDWFTLWAGHEDSPKGAYYRDYNTSCSYHHYDAWRYSPILLGVCKL